ncbi:MAG: phage terminase small subunit P27 family [Pseudodesulfovibrio sp.]|uniref:phage terminase small subunit P27 family n=1 Tax=Pseudodesulfovibrio sp. TaxID=2035812 RepID=UPI003D0DFF4C
MSTPKAPAHLSKEAKSWWDNIMNEYEIQDQAGQLILQTGLEAFDRMRQAQGLLKKEGMTTVDRFGQPKAHPMTIVERDNRAAMLAALRQLNLDLEPLNDRPGRPAGR